MIKKTAQPTNKKFRHLALESAQEEDGCGNETRALNYDKEKYREMILDAAETALGTFGFERTVYGAPKKRMENGGRN